MRFPTYDIPRHFEKNIFLSLVGDQTTVGIISHCCRRLVSDQRHQTNFKREFFLELDLLIKPSRFGDWSATNDGEQSAPKVRLHTQNLEGLAWVRLGKTFKV